MIHYKLRSSLGKFNQTVLFDFFLKYRRARYNKAERIASIKNM